MSDIDLVIQSSKRLEKILKDDFSAEGSGLGELTRDVEDILDPAIKNDLLNIVGIRNALVHEEQVTSINDHRLQWTQEDFIKKVNLIEDYLNQLKTNSPISYPQEKQTTPYRSNSRDSYQPPPYQYKKPWYRSTFFLILTFFFFQPLWVFLILSDDDQGCFIKFIAILFLVFQMIFCFAIFILSLGIIPSSFINYSLPDLMETYPFSTSSPRPVIPTNTNSPQDLPSKDCTIIWVEHKIDNLADKNRYQVWKDIVRPQVEGSGMTDKQFYQLALEHNPTLVTDHYVFVEEKRYLLPRCR